MKIISNKKQAELLKKIADCQNICLEHVDDIEMFSKVTGNLADIAFDIGGYKGVDVVLDYTHEFTEEVIADGKPV